MKLLLDTHALIWALSASDRLPRRMEDLLSDPANEVWASAVNAYEIEFKRARSPEIARLPTDIEDAVNAVGFAWMPIEARHAAWAGRLPPLHGDPFDRLLIAQALAENAMLVTRDPWIAPYGAPTLW
jgi:PIN domain nuclease of toxin-antitoxin system